MKLLLLAIFCIAVYNVRSQSIFLDKKDPFSKTRTIIANPMPLVSVSGVNILQAEPQVVIDGADTSFEVNFITPGINVSIDVKEKLPDTCMLMDNNNNVYAASVINHSTAFVMGRQYENYTCLFSKTDFARIIGSIVTDIKISTSNGHGGVFHVDKKCQVNIAKQAKIILQRLNT